MNGTQATIAVLGIALTIMTPTMFRIWVGRRVREREAQIKADSRLALSKEETRRMEIMRDALGRQPPTAAARTPSDSNRVT